MPLVISIHDISTQQVRFIQSWAMYCSCVKSQLFPRSFRIVLWGPSLVHISYTIQKLTASYSDTKKLTAPCSDTNLMWDLSTYKPKLAFEAWALVGSLKGLWYALTIHSMIIQHNKSISFSLSNVKQSCKVPLPSKGFQKLRTLFRIVLWGPSLVHISHTIQKLTASYSDTKKLTAPCSDTNLILDLST